MTRFLIAICLGLMLFSCKSKKAATSKKHKTKHKTEQVVAKPETPSATTTPETKPETANYPSSTEAYIALYKDIAKTEMQLYNIPASITMAQGILESGSGKGRLAREANNHFGIKCHDWTGDKIYHDDDAAQECFRKYIDAKYSYRDHSLFLTQRRRYAELFKLRKGDYKAWAKGLKDAGYATDKKYPHKLISLIERYDLHQLDKEVLGRTYRNPEAELYAKPKTTTIANTVNVTNTGTHIVERGETLYAISQRYGLSVQELQRLNHLSGPEISVGQQLKVVSALEENNIHGQDAVVIKVEEVAEDTDPAFHTVQKGETLYSLAKQYNTTVETLKTLNNLSDNTLSIGQELQVSGTER
ncbi:MAG: glucosaminidase domain-containing protein [Flavobacteriaceae bacterium]